MASPEHQSKELPIIMHPLVDLVFDHMVLSTTFAAALVANPRRTLTALRKGGIHDVAKGYKSFFDNMRPALYFR